MVSPASTTAEPDSLALLEVMESNSSAPSYNKETRAMTASPSYTNNADQHSSAVTAAPERSSHPHYRSPSRTIVELNSADSLDLVQLYNIGPAFARRIIKYRTLLGGFVAKRQLLEVYGMDTTRYNDVAPYVTVDIAAVRHIDINAATIDQLKRHPYLDYYQAKAIVQYREKAGHYHSIQDLQKITLIDQESYNQIAPYLSCNLPQSK